MRKLVTKAMMLFCACFMCAVSLTAQEMPIPTDPEVRIGKLDNGLTYYIRHNETPKGQADFYIAQKVGSILEEENQRGLAHFLEHMCFNGTTNFPGSSIIDWLESIGVKFGANLNAYTSVDQTVYNISNVPVDRESVQDSCLLILHDWANDLTLDPAEIDKERGVIHQEWRRAMVGQMRILENILPTIYPDSRYGYRLPIGTMEVVDNFPPQALRDYYETWYRPDQQGIIVVGDIDVDRIEGKIKEMFSSIEMPENAKPREYFPVADNDETIYAIGSDKEQQVGIVSLFIKQEAFPNEMKGDYSYLMAKYLTGMISAMLDNRFNEMTSNPDVPFAQAGASYDNFFLSKTADALDVTGVAKDGNVIPVLEAIYRELLRASRGGFTVSEYDRARDEYLSRLEKQYTGRNNRQSESYVNEYVNNFLDNEPIPPIEEEYQVMNMIAPMLSVDMINAAIKELVSDKNRVVMALLPDKEGLAVPTAEQLAEAIAKVDAEEIAPYVDEVKAEPLIPALPAPGKIVSETHNDRWDATEMVLSNGVKVIVKPTNFKDDEVLFEAQAVGGTSILPDEMATDLKGASLVLSQTGLGEYTNKDLQKYLAGKQANVNIDLDDYLREVSGKSTPKDLPTLMELIYMTFTDVTMSETEMKALQNQYAGILENQEKNPQFIFQRDLAKALYDNPRSQIITADDVRAINRDNVIDFTHKMTSNAADYTFTFVGTIDMDSFRPLVEQYIATLPADAANVRNTAESLASIDIRDGSGIDTFTTKMETPQTYVFFTLSANMPYTSKDAKIASIAGQILSNRLLKTVREDMGAVYSIGATCYMTRQPGKNVSLLSSFPMKPEMKQEVIDFINNEIAAMEGNITDEEVSKAVEYMVKNVKENYERNDAWLNAINGSLVNGVDSFNNAVSELQSITTDDIQNFVKALRAADNFRYVVLDPEE